MVSKEVEIVRSKKPFSRNAFQLCRYLDVAKRNPNSNPGEVTVLL
ncbi:hypothetical protein [Hymenobacter sp. AT01-02]|nr:hypothetical protein [Hymenobacter sp. AT01-02]